MENEYIFRPYKNGDETGIVELYRLSFPDWSLRQSPLEYWRWKYLENPYGSTITVAEFNGKIVGVAASLYRRVKIGETVFEASFGEDSATHPDHRGKGVYSNLVKMNNSSPLEMSKKFDYSITLNPIVIKDYVKRGAQVFPHTFSYLIYVRDLDKHLENVDIKNKKIIRIGYKLIREFNRLRSHTVSKDKGITILGADSLDERYDCFWDKFQREKKTQNTSTGSTARSIVVTIQ